MLTNSSILTQPENNAADRQISMVIVITQPENNAADRQISMVIVITNDKGCSQCFLLNPA